MRFILLLTIFITYINAFELEIDGGGGTYLTAAKGELVYHDGFLEGSSANIDHETADQLYLWSEIRSNITYLPYLRVEYAKLSTQGQSKIHINGSSDVNNIIDTIESIPGVSINDTYYDSRLVQFNYEAYLFYAFFQESDWPRVDLGVGAKKFDFDYSITAIFDGLEFNAHKGDIIPMVYVSTRFNTFESIKAFHSAFQADGKIYLFGDSEIYDYQLKMDFLSAYNATTDIGVEVGYKHSYFNIKGNDIDIGSGLMTYSGVFIGFIGHFR